MYQILRIFKKVLDFIQNKNYQEHLKKIFKIKQKEKPLEIFNNFNHFVVKTLKIILKNSIIFVINFDIFQKEEVWLKGLIVL